MASALADASASLRWNNRKAFRGSSGSARSAPLPGLPRRSAVARPLRAFRAAAAASDVAPEELVQSGAVVSAHGLKGEVRVMPFTDFVEERFYSPCTQFLEDEAQGRSQAGGYDKPPGAVSAVKIVTGREVTSKGRNECIIKIRGVNDRNAADALIGRRLYVLASDRPKLREEDIGDGDDEFYSSELEGMKVVLQETGEDVGVVAGVFRGAGSHDLLKVAVPPLPPTDGEEPKNGPEEHVFVPFVRDIVPVVNTKEGVIEITPPAGLLDLRQKTKKPKRQRARGPPPPRKKRAE